MIYAVLLFILVLSVDLVTDVRLYDKGLQPNKTRGALLRVIGLAPCVYWLGPWSIPGLFFLYLILFNGFYNILIGQPWEFLGTTSKIDLFLARFPVYLKYLFLIFFILLYLTYGKI